MANEGNHYYVWEGAFMVIHPHFEVNLKVELNMESESMLMYSYSAQIKNLM